jgi:putative ATP-binding cassette transporter
VVRAEQLTLRLPDGRVIVPEVNLTVAPGDRVLVTGPTGAGKSTLFRALAGIWPFGDGQVHVPAQARLLFLPQRPYLPVGTLRDVVAYPSPAGSVDDDAIRSALADVGLAGLADGLDVLDNWSLQLSGGEQQRLAIARAVLQQPDWLFLDEATAALDDAAEHAMYSLLQRRLPGAAIVSIAHRSGVAAFHDREVSLAPVAPVAPPALVAVG